MNLKLRRIWLTDQSHLRIMLKVGYPLQPYSSLTFRALGRTAVISSAPKYGESGQLSSSAFRCHHSGFHFHPFTSDQARGIRLAESGSHPGTALWDPVRQRTAAVRTATVDRDPRGRIGWWGRCSGLTNSSTSSPRLYWIGYESPRNTGAPFHQRDAPAGESTPSWDSSPSASTQFPGLPGWCYWPSTGTGWCTP